MGSSKKKCKKCGGTYDKDRYFARRATAKDGLAVFCLLCENQPGKAPVTNEQILTANKDFRKKFVVEIKKTRICLSCERYFCSEGIGNRICPLCARNDWRLIAPVAQHSVHIHRGVYGY